jgi:hypothetical protein
MLLRHKPLFNGTLGDWNLPPVSFEIKEDMKPYHDRTQSHPTNTQSHTHGGDRSAMQNWGFEVATIIKVGIANLHNTPKGWHSLYNFWFQGTKSMHSLEPNPIPKISMTLLQELEGFTYVTALDLNMGYYTIWLDAQASEMCTIIFS